MLQTHSPEKENRSPAVRKHKQQKELRSVQQLLHFLATSHLTLAPDLQAILTVPPNNEFKLIPSSPRDEQKIQLTVQIADLQFELKKVSEDFAEFKLLSKMDKDKTVRKIKEELEEQRTKNSEQSIKWQKKFSERSQQYQQECHNFKVSLENSMREQEKQRLHRITQEHNSTLNKLRRELDIAISQRKNELNSLEEAQRKKIHDLTKHYQHEIASLHKNQEVKVKRKQEQMVQKMLVMEKEKKEQIKLIEESKIESTKVQEKYLYQIGLSQRERKKLQQKVDDLEMKVKVYAKRLEDQTKAAEQFKKEHEQAIIRVENEKQQAVTLAEQLLSRQKSSFLREHYTRTEQLEQRVIRLAESKEQVESNYESLLRSLEQRFEKRESKRQDVEALRDFEEKLVNKQRENSHIYHQLRLIRLEKQNDEKLYTKIFSSAKKEKKSLSTRPENDINTLLRQSHTTDFRQLLKASQK